MSDVLDGTVGRILRDLRTERPVLLPCAECKGRTMLLRDGLCACCHSEKVYHEGTK